ncbi:MAG: bifunctional DNA-formamidopyrimidine glycosylase/DNA-(apurinic or apyrimidinic site) lyase [Saccharospirillaceae bacterium]|nr:bifunctional DNA-formamidopyrimidine glycosylase/DNA-(apurinic or apyrimidinic site) lyase [Pseudomonadales bacterium]NRB78507.1 bifunctional DNA-formamidopyrimidine glycosylase/DNA-(apurinic or apyrimidinic site) lyase [Saccharospirillaceae bacterium]
MPELPEVETTKNGLLTHIGNQTLKALVKHRADLRWPIEPNNPDILKNQKLLNIDRRSKYLLLRFETGTLMFHLGMSGSLRVCQKGDELKKHDHIELIFNDCCVRYNDPRRFGFCLWYQHNDQDHKLLKSLGPEPLTRAFNFKYFKQAISKRSAPIKNVIMDSKVVVGAGNIYATESLFVCGIHPAKPANELNDDQIKQLLETIKKTLKKAIKQGGTTLKDFINADGKPGYFQQTLQVYGKKGKPCKTCKTQIESIVLAGRASSFCPSCQLI